MAGWRLIPGLFGGGNRVLDGEGFYISYNANPGGGFSLFAADGESGDETALVKDGTFYILNGDFCDDYERLAPDGFDACLSFYDEKKAEHGSAWSS